jgi:hypothetical protein
MGGKIAIPEHGLCLLWYKAQYNPNRDELHSDGSKGGYSETKTDFWGDKYTQRYGDASSNPSGHAGGNLTSGSISRKQFGSSGGSRRSDSSSVGILFGFLIEGFIVFILVSLLSNTVKTYFLNSARSIKNYQYHGSRSSSLQPPVNFIRSYYEDLNRHDISATTTKWKNPLGNLNGLVKNVE